MMAGWMLATMVLSRAKRRVVDSIAEYAVAHWIDEDVTR